MFANAVMAESQLSKICEDNNAVHNCIQTYRVTHIIQHSDWYRGKMEIQV
jgi:hypothetical protein